MLAEGLLPNLLLFAIGQAGAFGYLRTGRFLPGALATAMLWLLADGWLLARYAYGVEAEVLRPLLLALQVTALLTALAFVFGRWHRRHGRAARLRPARFAAALQAYLRQDLPAAAAGYRQLLRTDPWDAAAWVALAEVRARQGQRRAALACCRHALAVDRRREVAMLAQWLRERLLARPGARAVAPAPAR